MTAPARVDVLDRAGPSSVLEIGIHEGRKRIVRRMLEAVGHPAIALERTGIGPLKLGRLAVGGSRRLRPAEVDALSDRAAAGNNPARERKAPTDRLFALRGAISVEQQHRAGDPRGDHASC